MIGWFRVPCAVDRRLAPFVTRTVEWNLPANGWADQIAASDGAWSECEQDDGTALVRVRGTAKLLGDLAAAYPAVTRPDLAWVPTRRSYVYDKQQEDYTVGSRLLPCRPLSDAAKDVVTDAEWDTIRQLRDTYLAQLVAAGPGSYVRIPRTVPAHFAKQIEILAARAGFGLNRLSTGTFPSNSTLLDDFNRSDGGLGSNWSGPHTPAYNASQPTIQSNLVSCVTGQTYQSAYWNVTSFNADQECRCVFTSGFNGLYLWTRIANAGSGTTDGYTSLFNGLGASGTVTIYRCDNETSFTGLGTTFVDISPDAAAGDQVGMDSIGSAHTTYTFTSGTWNTQISRTDSTYTAGGYIGIWLQGDGVDLDDFYGGNVLTPASPPFALPRRSYLLTR